jgi:hypothetical protein
MFTANKTTNTTTALIIQMQEKKLVSKQQTFNRLVKKIEKLRQELEQTNAILTKKSEFYLK